MAIKYEGDGDIFLSKRQTLICPVNTKGVMGNGLAAAFRMRCPGLFEAYKEKCKSGELTITDLYLFEPKKGPKVLCFPTKDEWWNDSKREWIEANVRKLSEEYEAMGITSIAVPPIGCGKGGLDYIFAVKPILHRYLDPIDLEVDILFHEVR